MQSEYLANHDQKVIKGEVFTFNNPIKGAINLTSTPNHLSSLNSLESQNTINTIKNKEKHTADNKETTKEQQQTEAPREKLDQNRQNRWTEQAKIDPEVQRNIETNTEEQKGKGHKGNGKKPKNYGICQN